MCKNNGLIVSVKIWCGFELHPHRTIRTTPPARAPRDVQKSGYDFGDQNLVRLGPLTAPAPRGMHCREKSGKTKL